MSSHRQSFRRRAQICYIGNMLGQLGSTIGAWFRSIPEPSPDGRLPVASEPGGMMAALEIERQAMLDIAAGAPLAEILRRMALAIEIHAEVETLASILLTDESEQRLFIGAAPSLPDAYNQAVDNLPVGPEVGSCGTAVFRGEGVFVTDIQQSALWRDFEPIASAHGLRSCWSIPIRGADGHILGSFALYHRTPRAPTRADVERIHLLGSIASVAIEYWRTDQALKQCEARCRELEGSIAAAGTSPA